MKKFQWKNWMSSVLLLLFTAACILGCIWVGSIFQPSVWWFFAVFLAIFLIGMAIFSEDVEKRSAGWFVFLTMLALLSATLLAVWALCLWSIIAGIAFLFLGSGVVYSCTAPFTKMVFYNGLCRSDSLDGQVIVFVFLFTGVIFGGAFANDYSIESRKSALIQNMHQDEVFTVEGIIKKLEDGQPYYDMQLSSETKELFERFPLSLSEVWDTQEGDRIRYVKYNKEIIAFDNLCIESE